MLNSAIIYTGEQPPVTVPEHGGGACWRRLGLLGEENKKGQEKSSKVMVVS